MTTRTTLADTIDGSHDTQYAPWVWRLTPTGRGALFVQHCTPDCEVPESACACFEAQQQSTLTAGALRTAYRQARDVGALCCPEPENFCAEDADQVLQRALYSQLVFG